MKDTRRRRYAIVTGASRGIGAEYARALATQGYDLLLVARDRDRLEQLAWELRSAYDVQVHLEVMDLSESDAAQRLYVASRQRGEQVDLLINNAGFGVFGPFTDLPMLDVTGREYYVTGLLSPEQDGRENILRGDASFTLRVFGRHGVALRYVVSHRDASYPNIEYRNQTVGTVSLMYVLLGGSGFGAVEWR